VSTTIPVELGDAPAFREPWQAKAFALLVLLHRNGHFGWDAWVRTLAAEIAASPQRDNEDAEMAYHRQFLAALETIVAACDMTTPEAMQTRKDAWQRAYLNTPHGHPVELAAAGVGHRDDDHDEQGSLHRHGHVLAPRRAPVAVSPPRELR
jgi:nitrile hydratase accessory protein